MILCVAIAAAAADAEVGALATELPDGSDACTLSPSFSFYMIAPQWPWETAIAAALPFFIVSSLCMHYSTITILVL